MIYENDYGKVDFFPSNTILDDKKKIGINLSGGADSALVLYMLANESASKKFDIIPITGIDIKRPTNIWNAREIVDLIQEKFPESNIKDHEENRYEKEHEKDKSNIHSQHERSLFRDNKVDLIVHCRTSNPPLKIAKENNLLEKREEIRDHDQQKSLFPGNKKYYFPLTLVDKRFVAEEYKKLNLMENLFPITASCIAYADKTDNFTKPCKECWWCKEKKWAFGMYDGGVL